MNNTEWATNDTPRIMIKQFGEKRNQLKYNQQLFGIGCAFLAPVKSLLSTNSLSIVDNITHFNGLSRAKSHFGEYYELAESECVKIYRQGNLLSYEDCDFSDLKKMGYFRSKAVRTWHAARAVSLLTRNQKVLLEGEVFQVGGYIAAYAGSLNAFLAASSPEEFSDIYSKPNSSASLTYKCNYQCSIIRDHFPGLPDFDEG